MREDLDRPGNVALSGIRDKLTPVTAWRRRLRWARYLSVMVVLPIAAQVALFLFLWWSFARRH
jgi:hypothetical protein